LIDDPDTFDAIEQFVQKLLEINSTIELLVNFLASSSRMADNANGIVSTAREALGDTDLYETSERIKQAASTGTRMADEVVPTLSKPETIESIKQLMEMLPRLVEMMQLMEQFAAGLSRFAENLNSIVSTERKAAEDKWPDLLDRQGIIALPGKVLDVVNSPALRQLLESRVLSDEALNVMDQVADATVEAHSTVIEKDEKLTRFGAFKALGDPDVQRGLALTIELSRALGRRMSAQRTAGSNTTRPPE